VSYAARRYVPAAVVRSGSCGRCEDCGWIEGETNWRAPRWLECVEEAAWTGGRGGKADGAAEKEAEDDKDGRQPRQRQAVSRHGQGRGGTRMRARGMGEPPTDR
jgi:hypothetical protein